MNSAFLKNRSNNVITHKKYAYKSINSTLFLETITHGKANAEKITKFSLKIIEK